jgi:hypothetical protein
MDTPKIYAYIAPPLVLAYLAGVIDSDGSITVKYAKTRESKGFAPDFAEYITITQVNPEAIELLYKFFNGSNITTKKGGSAKSRPLYRWNASNRSAVQVIKALLPYLRIKRRQADIVLRLRTIKQRGRNANTYLEEMPILRNTRWGVRPFRRRFLKPEVREEMMALVVEVRALNDTRTPNPFSDSLTI